MKVLVVFTYGYSLKTWEESGTLERELSIYTELQKKYGVKFTFLTYGDHSDLEIAIKNIDVDFFVNYIDTKQSVLKIKDLIKSKLGDNIWQNVQSDIYSKVDGIEFYEGSINSLIFLANKGFACVIQIKSTSCLYFFAKVEIDSIISSNGSSQFSLR